MATRWHGITSSATGANWRVASSFDGSPFATELHVVQQSGSIQPPHIFEHDSDDTTVLSGLPNGTWYVKVYEGALAGTTMAVDGGTPLLTDIVEGVPDGVTVHIDAPIRAGGSVPPGL